MEDSKPTEQDKAGFLFISDFDGCEWSNYLVELLQNKPYNIPCLSAVAWDLTEELTKKCSLLVLIFTPDMESRAESLNFDLLQPNSKHSCLIECNAQVSNTNMPSWTYMYTLEPTVESQRELLIGLIDLYEEITGNIDVFDADTDTECIMDVVPSILYPGQREVHILFSYQEKAEVTVSVVGVADKIPTRKSTKTVHVFYMPEKCLGQKNINIFIGDQNVPIFSTKIIIFDSEVLADCLTLNLWRFLSASDSEEMERKSDDSSLDPFSQKYCNNDILKKYWLNLKQMVADLESEKAGVKSPIKQAVKEKPEVVEQEAVTDSAILRKTSRGRADFKSSHKPASATFANMEASEEKPKEVYQEAVTDTVVLRRKTKKDKITNFFKKLFKNDAGSYQVRAKKAKSKRSIMAKGQKIECFPHFPEKK